MPALMAFMNVMIVDDNALFARLMGMAAADFLPAAKVSVYTSSRVAMRAFDRSPNKWAALITDLLLPGDIDGLTLAEHITAARPVPVLFVTAYALDQDPETRARIGRVGGCVSKEQPIAVIFERLRDLLGAPLV